MTTMYKVSVDAVEGPTLDGRIHLVNADAPAVPHQTVFPLALLTDAWRLLANGFLRDEGYEERGLDRCPFSPEQGKAIVADMRLNGEYAVVLRTGTRLTLSRGYREKLQERLAKTV